MIIYQITNNVNGKFYIGQTKKSIEERFKRHYYNAKYGSNTYLYNSMRKYGIENFSISVIEQTESLNEREIFWISELNPQYNMTRGGEGGDTSNSPNFKNGVKKYHLNKPKESYATYGMQGKKQSQKFFDSISISNAVPVMCEGVRYESIKEAQEHYPGISLSKRLNSDKYPDFYKLKIIKKPGLIGNTNWKNKHH